MTRSPFVFQIVVIMLDPCNLSLLSDDPQLGIKAVTKSITVVLSSSNQVSIKENLCKMLSTSLNQYSPDIGGIVLGYSNISHSKVHPLTIVES